MEHIGRLLKKSDLTLEYDRFTDVPCLPICGVAPSPRVHHVPEPCLQLLPSFTSDDPAAALQCSKVIMRS
jgi:hypothetical protein